jgi:hypothetical protein
VQLCSSTEYRTAVGFRNVKQRRAFELTDAHKTPLCIFNICITPYVQVLSMLLMSSPSSYLQNFFHAARLLETTIRCVVRVGVLMRSSPSIASPLPALALLVGSISLYRRRAIYTGQLTPVTPCKGQKVPPLTWLWFTKFAHGRTCAIKAEYLLFLAATPCMYGVKLLCPYSGSPFLTLSTISRISISTSLLFSVQP